MTSLCHSAWCAFRAIPSAAEAALISGCCRFSLATLEVFCHSDAANYALIEKEESGIWRWVITDADGLIVDEGRQRSQTQARRAAEKHLRLVALPTAYLPPLSGQSYNPEYYNHPIAAMAPGVIFSAKPSTLR